MLTFAGPPPAHLAANSFQFPRLPKLLRLFYPWRSLQTVLPTAASRFRLVVTRLPSPHFCSCLFPLPNVRGDRVYFFEPLGKWLFVLRFLFLERVFESGVFRNVSKRICFCLQNWVFFLPATSPAVLHPAPPWALSDWVERLFCCQTLDELIFFLPGSLPIFAMAGPRELCDRCFLFLHRACSPNVRCPYFLFKYFLRFYFFFSFAWSRSVALFPFLTRRVP